MRLKFIAILILAALLCGCSNEEPGSIATLAGVEIGESFRHYGKQLLEDYGSPETAASKDLKMNLYYYPAGDFTVMVKNAQMPEIIAVVKGVPPVPVMPEPNLGPDWPFYKNQ